VTAAPPLLEIEDLWVSFRSANGRIAALNGVSFAVARGQVLALLGESGSGKSVTAAAIMGLIEQPPGTIERGSVRLDGTDLLTLSRAQHRGLCGEKLALVFQDALAALNPVYSVGWQIAEAFRIHGRLGARAAHERAVALMEQVGIPAARERARLYPHQFSGGMRQRVVIAMAMALRPALIIADEPTTALDVTVQAQIVELLRQVREETSAGLILITHDLGVVAELADAVAVMYAGRIVERADVRTLFRRPAHPYTRGLLASQPRIDEDSETLRPIPGTPPNPAQLPSGCPFHPRCARAEPVCATSLPPLRDLGDGQQAACHFAGDAA
jgi:oligopeptide transport system ATP-binding protein